MPDAGTAETLIRHSRPRQNVRTDLRRTSSASTAERDLNLSPFRRSSLCRRTSPAKRPNRPIPHQATGAVFRAAYHHSDISPAPVLQCRTGSLWRDIPIATANLVIRRVPRGQFVISRPNVRMPLAGGLAKTSHDIACLRPAKCPNAEIQRPPITRPHSAIVYPSSETSVRRGYHPCLRQNVRIPESRRFAPRPAKRPSFNAEHIHKSSSAVLPARCPNDPSSPRPNVRSAPVRRPFDPGNSSDSPAKPSEPGL